jgi:alpha-D-xyloside xylohydrolase
MRFSDGAWLMQEGVVASYATEGVETALSDRAATTLVATRPIRHRGDTLQGPTLTVTLWSPIEGVIGVKIVHFSGGKAKTPNFELNVDPTHPVDIKADKEFVVVTSGKLTARLNLSQYSLEFLHEATPLTSAESRATAYATLNGDQAYIHEQLGLSVGENVYGLGERFTAFVKNGQSVEMWNRDGGTDSDQAYKNVPFYLSNQGYGVFVNHPGKVEFEIATEKVSRLQFSAQGESLEYFLIDGPTPKEVLGRYTALTGRAPLPPAWTFGLWLTTSFTTNYDEETVTSFINGMADRNLPLHVFHFDCFWMKGFHWTDLEWDPAVFPDPTGMVARLHKMGLKVSAWINPYIAQASKLFQEGVDGGYLIKKANGDVWQWDLWQPGMGIVDFTNPAACEWFASKLSYLLGQGVDALKTDFGERIPTDVVYFDGSDPERMHNYYTQLYNRVCYEVIQKVRGPEEAVLFARSATAGGQKYPIHWGGDCWSTFEAMAESLRGGLSLGLSGFGFWSHDIGGFEGLPPAALYKRWVAFGLLSSHSRLHGSSSYRVPWLYDDEAVDTVRFFTQLKCRLMPYLYQQAKETSESGVPLMRAMFVEFPEDPTCDMLDRQYMLGENVLVAPIFNDQSVAHYYVPEGVWTHVLSGQVHTGPTWVKENHGYLSLPLLARPNSILAFGATDDQPSYDFGDDVTFRVFGLEEGMTAECRICSNKGLHLARAIAKRSGDEITFEVDGALGAWSVLFIGLDSLRVKGSGQLSQENLGTRVTPTEGHSIKVSFAREPAAS